MSPRNHHALLASVGFACTLFTAAVFAEGSRNLYPADYDARGPAASRAHLDLQPQQTYINRVSRRAFLYAYAEAGEFILLGSSNVANGGDVLVFNPQDFGTRGDETIPALADFSCVDGPADALDSESVFGNGLGHIANRAEELAGPNAANGALTVADGFDACAYRAPVDGIYGIAFTPASGSFSITASVDTIVPADESVGAWDVTVRATAGDVEDINGRLFTYAFIGFTAGNNRPVYTTHWYVTEDGYRYRQDLHGLDPNGWALYANTFGFLDNGEPLYRNIRSDNALISNIPAGLSTQPAEYPMFFSDISPDSEAAPNAEAVLDALGIPLSPAAPEIRDVRFTGTIGDAETTTGAGGHFTFSTTDTLSYQIIISRDGADFNPATGTNRLLTGIAFSGDHEVFWDGRDNDGNPFEAGEDYAYRAFGRNGEVHFPIIDAENNGNPDAEPPIPGGGPEITRLNGPGAGDKRVFFDDRGYLTSRGDAVGVPNGTLCDSAVPAAPAPAQALAGVESDTPYRLWENGRNRNRDCASDAGWGDAKALNLWTFFLTPESRQTLDILPVEIDLATTVSVAGTAEAGSVVQGTFSFSNNGEQPATGVSWQMQLSPQLTNVSFDNLPSGVSAAYDPNTGAVTFTGAPETMLPGDDYTGLIFRYTAPATGPVLVSTTISSEEEDVVPSNNSASAQTAIGDVDVAAFVEGLPASVEAGETVTGTVRFQNLGGLDAQDVTYALTFGEDGNRPDAVNFSNLPPGASVSYDPQTGVATLSGLPQTLTVGDLQTLDFSYTAPRSDAGPIEVVATIGTSSLDANPANNSDSMGTDFFYIELTVQAVCINDAPYVDYTATAVGFVPAGGATLSFIGSDAVLVETRNDLPLAGRELWPGAAVDPATGRGSAWPGWAFENGAWVEIPSTLRPETTVRVSVNPSFEETIAYPPATPNCATNPPADLVSVISGVPAEIAPGEVINGSVAFRNIGGTAADGVSYTFTIGDATLAPDAVDFSNLPPGVGVSYDAATGVVTLTGMPETLAPGDTLSLDFSFTLSGVEGQGIVLRSDISTPTTETDLDNNPDAAPTTFRFPQGASLSVTAAAVCINDAPYVEYDIQAVNFTPSNLATLEFIGSNGQVLESITDLPLENGRVLWPEAAVDANGRGVAWPGWELVDGVWVEIPSLVRPEMTVRFSVNPSFEQTFSYPPATPACETDPPQLNAPAPPAPAVPVPVGGPATPLLTLLLGLLGASALRRSNAVRRQARRA